MRLPYAKVYRAFPELDRFSDAECERFVLQATRGSFRRWLQRTTLRTGAALAAFIAWFAVMLLLNGLLGAIRSRADWVSVVMVAFSTGFVAFPLIVSLLVRDAWLRRAVRARLVSAQCPACEYSMLGLPVVNGIAKCPECGQGLDLAKLGLTPADLLCPAEPASVPA